MSANVGPASTKCRPPPAELVLKLHIRGVRPTLSGPKSANFGPIRPRKTHPRSSTGAWPTGARPRAWSSMPTSRAARSTSACTPTPGPRRSTCGRRGRASSGGSWSSRARAEGSSDAAPPWPSTRLHGPRALRGTACGHPHLFAGRRVMSHGDREIFDDRVRS